MAASRPCITSEYGMHSWRHMGCSEGQTDGVHLEQCTICLIWTASDQGRIEDHWEWGETREEAEQLILAYLVMES
jgi:hypothetical protein